MCASPDWDIHIAPDSILRWRKSNDNVGVDRDRVGFPKSVSAMRLENTYSVPYNQSPC